MSRIKRHKLRKQEFSRKKEEPFFSKKAIWTIILGSIMVFSIFGIMFSSFNSGQDTLDYGKHTFKRTNTGWSLKIDDKTADFRYFPSDVEQFNISTEIKSKILDSKVIYITFSPTSKGVQEFELARFELSESMNELFGIFYISGISNQSDDYKQPLIDCRNATSILPVINLVYSNTTRAYLENDCIILEGERETIAAIKDRLLYSLLGII